MPARMCDNLARWNRCVPVLDSRNTDASIAEPIAA